MLFYLKQSSASTYVVLRCGLKIRQSRHKNLNLHILKCVVLMGSEYSHLSTRGATTFSKLGVQFLGLGYCTEQNTDGIPSFVHCSVLRNGNHTIHQKSWGGPSNFFFLGGGVRTPLDPQWLRPCWASTYSKFDVPSLSITSVGIKTGWVQWLICPDWGQCFEFPSRLWCCRAWLFTGSIARSAKRRLYITQWPIWRFFAPQGRHVAPMGVKFGTEAHSSVLNFTP